MSKKDYNVAVVGATGVVGKEIIKILEERSFPVRHLIPLASQRSIGEIVTLNRKDYPVGLLDDETFKDIDIALFSPGASVSKIHAPKAAKAGCVVIDNTSHFRMDTEVPLVVPEVNPEAVADYTKRNIIANPNCSTIQMVVALKPIHDKYNIKRVVVSTYQAVSGSGKEAVDELSGQVRNLFSMKAIEVKKYPHQIAFNCMPQIDDFTDNGYTKEEMKMINETHKIFGNDNIKVSPTCVRVSVFNSHSESINIETEKDFDIDEVRKLLSESPGIKVVDNPDKNEYPMPIEASEEDEVFVGRIRRDDSIENGMNMWVVSDNLRKGAALNTVQIAEVLIDKYL